MLKSPLTSVLKVNRIETLDDVLKTKLSSRHYYVGITLKVNLFMSHNIVTSRQGVHFSDFWTKLIILRFLTHMDRANKADNNKA